MSATIGVDQPSAGAAAGTVIEGNWTSWAQVYGPVALSSAPGTTSGTVDNSGRAIVDLNNATVDMFSHAGVKTNDAVHTSGGIVSEQGAQSVNGTYVAMIADQQKGANIWKNGAYFVSLLSNALTSPTRIAISPSGQYIFMMDLTDNTVELWQGS